MVLRSLESGVCSPKTKLGYNTRKFGRNQSRQNSVKAEEKDVEEVGTVFHLLKTKQQRNQGDRKENNPPENTKNKEAK